MAKKLVQCMLAIIFTLGMAWPAQGQIDPVPYPRGSTLAIVYDLTMGTMHLQQAIQQMIQGRTPPGGQVRDKVIYTGYYHVRRARGSVKWRLFGQKRRTGFSDPILVWADKTISNLQTEIRMGRRAARSSNFGASIKHLKSVIAVIQQLTIIVE